jgi:choline transport protein
MIVFGVLAPKHTASYVFVETSNTSGWENNGVSWLIGLVSTVYPFLGYDAAVHLSEEMENPSRNVPIAMVGSVIVNGILGFGYCLMLLFSLGDLNELLLTPTGFPFMQLFLNITNNNSAATFLSLFISITAVMANSAGLTATSRTAWAFARDSALPFSNYFTHISGSEHVPARMIVLVTILQGLVGLLYLGSYTAFNAVLSMAILGVYVSYLLPIVYMITYGRTADKEHPHGYFRLSKIGGTVVNTAAIVWLLIGIVFSTFPSYQPVTPENMNWSVVVMGGWMMCGAVYYCVWGRKSYNGPLLEVTAMVDAQQVKEISEK